MAKQTYLGEGLCDGTISDFGDAMRAVMAVCDWEIEQTERVNAQFGMDLSIEQVASYRDNARVAWEMYRAAVDEAMRAARAHVIAALRSPNGNQDWRAFAAALDSGDYSPLAF